MRVIVVSDAAKISGGAEKVALLSALALAKSGMQTTAFTGTGPIDSSLLGIENLSVICTGHVSFYEIASRKAALKQAIWNSEAAAQFAEVLAGHDPTETVVHFHSYLRVLSASTVAIALEKGFRVVITLHDYGLACPNQCFYNFRTREICRLKPMSLACISTNCTLRNYTNKAGMLVRSAVLAAKVRWKNRVKQIIAVSNESGEIMRPFLGNAEINVVLNPVDVPHSAPVQVKENKKILFVGKLEPLKDPARAAQAALNQNMPITFVGEGACREEILLANPAAEITGWVTPERVRAEQQSARCLLMTSRWYEAAPLVIFDALAAGIPVLVPSTCAGKEFVQHGKTGFVYDSAKPGELERCLEMLKDDETAETMGLEAHENFWQNPPSMERHLQGLLKVYEKALA